MSLPFWQSGTFYNPGATVQPVTQPAISTPAIPNAGFESGNVEWATGTGWTIESGTGPEPAFEGTKYAKYSGSGAADARIVSNTNFPVRVGQSITAKIQVRRTRTSYTGGRVELDWLDAGEVLIFSSQGNLVETTGSTSGNWRPSEVTAFAPAGAAFVRVAGFAYRTQGTKPLWIDAFSWNYSFTAEGAGLVFTAVQPNAGYSAATEPQWPTVNGQQVIDNEVIWEAIEGTRVVWEAHPILVSDYLEPDWPIEVGASVADNTIIWTAVARRVTDAKCPNTAIVVIAASKVFSGDNDIIGFSATVNPLDWTTVEDAGFLPFGLQNFGANPVTAMGLYRTNLAAFNSEGFQMWQVDENPDNMAVLDAGPISCVWPRTVLPVMNDLVFLSGVGVRNIGIAGASTNLQVGEFGQPVDPIVLAKLQAGEFTPFSLFVPAYGQYWLFFGDEAIVLTVNGNKIKSWSRYTFPEAITDWTLEGNDLLLRTATHKVWRVTDELTDDDHNCPTVVVDLPFMPVDLAAGTLEIDANYVLDKRPMTDFGDGVIAPDSYGSSPAVFSPPAYALVASYMVPGASSLSVRVHGTDSAAAVVSETITFNALTAQRWIVGTQLFATITGSEQLNADDADFQYSVGYQRFVANEAVAILTVTIHGAITVENSSTPIDASTDAGHGILNDVASVYVLPAAAVPLIRHNINTTTSNRTYTVDGGEAIVLPAGSPGQEVAGVVAVGSITQIVRTGAGGANPFVDVGIEFTVDAACVGEDIVGVIQWPHLDLGSFGVEKQFIGFDLVATAPEGVSVSIGYDQRDLTRRTADYLMDADTLPGKLVPIAVTAPSFDMRLTFEPGQRWEWNASCLYINDRRPGA